MKNKIEKIPDDKKYYEESEFVEEVIEKLKQIIDHLNSQVQPEEIDNTKLVMPPSAYDQAEKEGFNMKNKVKSKLLPQDTPEEWEEKQRNLIEKAQEKYFDFRRREQLLDGDVEIYRNTREYVEKELVEDIINFTKQLLKERERWAIDTFLKDTASYNSFHNGRPRTMRNGLSGEGFEVRVSKLSKKK